MSWKKVEKRIGQLIDTDRYLNPAEKESYPQFLKDQDTSRKRQEIANEFRSIVYDYNDYVAQLGEPEKKLNLYLLSDCWMRFTAGDPKTHARTMEGEFILPVMREAMKAIANDHMYSR